MLACVYLVHALFRALFLCVCISLRVCARTPQAVKRNSAEYGLPLHIVTYTDLYGWTMDEIVKATGKRNNCV